MAADTFQFKRGTTAAVNAYLPAIGEPVYDITLKKFRIGDGVTLGGVDPTIATPNISALNGLTGAADKGFYFTGPGTMATYDLTAQARLFTAATTVVAQRSVLGLTIGSNVQAFDTDLDALAANATNGLWARTASGAGSARTITGTASEITVTNGDGVAGNPTLSLPAAIALAGKALTGGTLNNCVIGGVTPVAGTFTTLTANTNVNLVGGQIIFPAVQVPSGNANTLDDYVENTFTPSITFSTPGDVNVVYSVRQGTYTKVGRLVTFWINLTTTTFTHTTASGGLQITGLPFTAVANPPATLGRWVGITSAVATPQINAIINGTTITFEVMNIAAGTTSTLTTANAATGVQKNIFISGSYNV